MAVDAEGVLLDARAANGAVDHEGVAVMGLAEAFRRNLRARRRAAGLSLERLDGLSGYSEKYIGSVERGDKPNPTLAFVEAMAGSLGCRVGDLLGV